MLIGTLSQPLGSEESDAQALASRLGSTSRNSSARSKPYDCSATTNPGHCDAPSLAAGSAVAGAGTEVDADADVAIGVGAGVGGDAAA